MKKYIEPNCMHISIEADRFMQDGTMGVLIGSGAQFDDPNAIEAPVRGFSAISL